MNPNTPALYRQMAKSGLKSSKARISVLMIEGESLTYAQIAKRLDCTVDVAQARCGHARRKGRAITWSELTR